MILFQFLKTPYSKKKTDLTHIAHTISNFISAKPTRKMIYCIVGTTSNWTMQGCKAALKVIILTVFACNSNLPMLKISFCLCYYLVDCLNMFSVKFCYFRLQICNIVSSIPSKIWASAKLPKPVWISANLPKQIA